MRQNQSQQPADTRQMAESTMDQGQRAMEQLIELQRNMARTTLSALEWQETAQKQGLEMTRSMLQNTPGQQFTESMMQRYLQGMEAVMPEMERVMERGFEAASQPRLNQGEQMGGQRAQTGGQLTDRGRQEIGQQTETPSGQQQGMQPSQQQGMQPSQQQGRQPNQQQGVKVDRQGTSSHSQPHRSQQSQKPTQYAQTGEWISPGEYGGESAGATGYQQQPMTTEPSHSSGQFEQENQQNRRMQGPRQRTEPHQYQGTEQEGRGRIQHGGPTEHNEQELPDRERRQSAQQRQSPMQTGQGRLREQYSQRLDPDRRGQGEQPPSTDRGKQGPRDQRERPSPRSAKADAVHEPDRGETTATDETDEVNETDRSSDRSARSATPEGDADEDYGIDEE